MNTEPEATHVHGGTLDLTIVSTDLFCPNIQWSLHPTLTSDHFAINITLNHVAPGYPILPPPRWNIKKINWNRFQQELDNWSATYIPPHTVSGPEKDLVRALHSALEKACPTSHHGNRQYKDLWYCNDEVKELYARVNTARKLFRRHICDDNRELL